MRCIRTYETSLSLRRLGQEVAAHIGGRYAALAKAANQQMREILTNASSLRNHVCQGCGYLRRLRIKLERGAKSRPDGGEPFHEGRFGGEALGEFIGQRLFNGGSR